MESLKCKNCDKELTSDMEIEYSRLCCEYFCRYDCAVNYYFDYMESTILDFNDLNKNIKIKDGKLFIKDEV